ncbi:MAG: MFS transporter [Actinomycetaceae bacterium]|nr:MFS transporter [Actinomycetaceae bacterium]MDY5854303.1 MFS transporter [Arcanobacterium sp.]
MASLRSLVADTRPLRSAPFRRMWLAYIVTVIGAQFTVVAVPAQIYADTKSSGYVGLTGVFALVPLIVFGLWGGALADHFDRRRLLIVTTVGIIVTSAAFFVVTALGSTNVWVLLVVFAMQQGFFAVNSPVRTAILPQLVPAAILPSANALNITVMSIGGIAGPLIGGMLIPLVGIKWLYLADVFFLLPTLAAVISLPPLKPRAPAVGRVSADTATADGEAAAHIGCEDETSNSAGGGDPSGCGAEGGVATPIHSSTDTSTPASASVSAGASVSASASTSASTASSVSASADSKKTPAAPPADSLSDSHAENLAENPADSHADSPVPGIGAIVDGLRYLRGRTILVMSFVVDLIAMICGNPRALFAQISHESFGGDLGGGLAFGLLYAAIPAGAALGGLFSGWLSRVRRQGQVVMIAIWFWGIGVLGFGLCASVAGGQANIWLVVAVVSLAMAGAADMCSSALRNAILLTETDDALRGRLQSIFFVVVVGGPRIADVVHGGAGEFLGAPGASMTGAVLVLIGIGICAVKAPSFWGYEAPRQV